MSLLVRISLQYTSTSELLVTAQIDSTEAKAYASLSTEAKDLIAEFKTGRATQRALSSAQELVNSAIMVGEVSRLFADHFHRAEQGDQLTGLISLSCPDELHQWPWELLCVPGSSQPLLLSGFELVRVIAEGNSSRQSLPLIRRGRVATKESEIFKFSAIRAATAHISRLHQIEVGVTHKRADLLSEVRDQRYLFNHVYAVNRQGYLTLDTDSRDSISLSETPLAECSYLLNITPPILMTEVIASSRAGASFVIARQFEQSAKARAEADRALYHALGSKFSISGAINWARQALAQSEPDGYHWASLVCMTRAEEWRTDAPLSLSPFPPLEPTQKSQSKRDYEPNKEGRVDSNTGSFGGELQEGQLKLGLKPRVPPHSTESFVNETVELIQKSQQSGAHEDKLELALRTAAMRQLSEIVQRRKILPQPDLSRSAQLAHQLIEAGTKPDAPLSLPDQWYGRAQRVADSLGLKVDAVAQATRALITAPTIWVYGLDARTREIFARALCEEIYQSFPYEPLPASVQVGQREEAQVSQTSFKEPTPVDQDSRVSCGLEVLHALSWPTQQARAGESALKGDQRLTQLLVGLHPESEVWRVYERAWLVIDLADLTTREQRLQAKLAMRRGQLRAQTRQGEAVSLDLSRASRIIYTSDAPPQRPAGEVAVCLRAQPEMISHLWRQELRETLRGQGLNVDLIEARLTSSLTSSFIDVMTLAVELDLIGIRDAFEALNYGALSGADEPSYTEAAELFLHPALMKDQLRKDCLIAFAEQDQEGYEASWHELRPDQPPWGLPDMRVIL